MNYAYVLKGVQVSGEILPGVSKFKWEGEQISWDTGTEQEDILF